MKKWLIISISINIMLLAAFTVRRMQAGPQRQSEREGRIPFTKARTEIISLPIDSNDIVFVGDSQTEGFPVAEIFGAKNRGVGMNETRDVLERIGSVANARKVFIQVGINDIRRGVPLDSAFSNYQKIVECLEGEVFIQSVLPVGNSYPKASEINKKVDSLNVRLRTLGTFIQLPNNVDSLTYDGIHLNKKGYDLWLKLVRPYLM